jgi:hypothetical protein
MPVSRILFTAILCISIVPVRAQLVTDRPDQTESSRTVGKGYLQIESGFVLGFDTDEWVIARRILAPTTLFRYGVTRGIELRVVSQFESVKALDEHYQGISDMEIGAKIQVLKKEGVNTEIAFLSSLLLPTGTLEYYDESGGIITKLAVSHSLNETLGLGYNLGYTYPGSGNGNLTYSLVLGVEVNDRVGMYIEPFGEVLDMSEFQLNANAGLTYLVRENLQLDFSFGTGLINRRMNFLSTGVSWKIAGKNSE